MTFRLGLTGSIGMGKTTTARMFAELGCDVWDADSAVHRLYSKSGAAIDKIRSLFPEAIVDGAVDRSALKTIISENPKALNQIENIVHPLVAADRAEFRKSAKSGILVFDIPLLFETGGDVQMDAVACVFAPPDVQEQRVLDRGTMTKEQFRLFRKKQMPIAEKLAKSDYVIVTDTPDHARQQVSEIVARIRGENQNA